jgi:hypothetical protein
MIGMPVSIGIAHKNTNVPFISSPSKAVVMNILKDVSCLFNKAAMFRYTKNRTPVIQRRHNDAVLYMLTTTSG